MDPLLRIQQIITGLHALGYSYPLKAMNQNERRLNEAFQNASIALIQGESTDETVTTHDLALELQEAAETFIKIAQGERRSYDQKP